MAHHVPMNIDFMDHSMLKHFTTSPCEMLDRPQHRGGRSRSTGGGRRMGEVQPAKPNAPAGAPTARRPVLGGGAGGAGVSRSHGARVRSRTHCEAAAPCAATQQIIQQEEAKEEEIPLEDLKDCASSFVMNLMEDVVADESEDDMPQDIDVDLLDEEDVCENHVVVIAEVSNNEAQAESVEEEKASPPLHGKVFEALLRGVQSGGLMQALRSLKGLPDTEAETENTDELKNNIFSTLLDSARNGSLVGALREVRQEREAEEKKQKEEAGANEAQMKGQIMRAMLGGLHTGGLGKALSQASEARLQKQKADEDRLLKEEARDMLQACLLNGQLAEALNSLHLAPAEEEEDEDVEVLRKDVRETLLQGVSDGRLEAALQALSQTAEEEDDEIDDDEMMKLKQEARDTLLHGISSGKLAEALEGLSQPPKEEQAELGLGALKGQILDALVKGSLSGILAQVLASLPHRHQEADEESDFEQEEDKEEVVVDNLRKSVFGSLIQGMRLGTLDEALKSLSPPAHDVHVEPLQQQAAPSVMDEEQDYEDVMSLASEDDELSEEELEAMAVTYVGAAFQQVKHAMAQSEEAALQREEPSVIQEEVKPEVQHSPQVVSALDTSNLGAYLQEHVVPVSFSFFAGKFASAAPAPAPRPAAADAIVVAARPLKKADAARPAPLLSLGSASPVVSRTKHKIVGGVTRASPANSRSTGSLAMLEKEPAQTPQSPAKLGELKGVHRAMMSSPNLRSGSPAGSLRPRLKESVATFRMDLSDDEEQVLAKPTLVRKSSFTNAFDALGKVDFHSMADSDTEPAEIKPVAAAKLRPLIVPVTPKSKSRPMSRSMSSSAMALDLGHTAAPSAACSPPSSSRPGPSSSPVPLSKLTKSSSSSMSCPGRNKVSPGFLPSLSSPGLNKSLDRMATTQLQKGARSWNRSMSSMVL